MSLFLTINLPISDTIQVISNLNFKNPFCQTTMFCAFPLNASLQHFFQRDGL